jgi:predicted PurR-regulated permease PerM
LTLSGSALALSGRQIAFSLDDGAKIHGIVGIYLSIPAIVVVRVIWQTWFNPNPQTVPDLVPAGKNR